MRDTLLCDCVDKVLKPDLTSKYYSGSSFDAFLFLSSFSAVILMVSLKTRSDVLNVRLRDRYFFKKFKIKTLLFQLESCILILTFF